LFERKIRAGADDINDPRPNQIMYEPQSLGESKTRIEKLPKAI